MITVLTVLGILILLYFVPAPAEDFFKRYPENDPVAHRLLNFRARPLKSVEVDSSAWKYYSGGKGEKTLLFVHGMGGTYDIWWNQIYEFERDYKIITFSLPKEIHSLIEAQKGILAILEAEHVDRFIIIGTSMGGYIAQYLLESIPERVEKAVFGNTFPPNRLIVKVNKRKRALLPWLPEILIWKFGQRELQQKLLPAGHNDKVLAAFLPGLSFSKKQFINRYDVVIDPYTISLEKPEIKAISKLILESDNDPLVPTLLRAKMKNTWPEAQIHSFHNEGHFPYLTAIREFNRVLRLFFNS